ncbi:MAG: TIGR03790 family protein [Verrucomicrobia bacterium]|nr:TIGR03790 family protein [Verrucomicrobiota bacterium]
MRSFWICLLMICGLCPLPAAEDQTLPPGENTDSDQKVIVLQPPTDEEEAARTAVVYNKHHPASLEIARHYIQLRNIPEDHLIELSLPFTAGIERADYEQRIEMPIREALSGKNLLMTSSNTVSTNAIRYLVLCRGIPFVILNQKGEDQNSRDKTGAAVDSELASLPLRLLNSPRGFDGQLRCFASGLSNPYIISPRTGVLMTARLDGPSDRIANSLVDKALQAEKEGLWGKCLFDVRGLTNSGYLQGDLWLRGASEVCRLYGFETRVDTRSETVSGDVPLDALAFYAGWYDYNASGPFKNGLVEFMPGAFAYHLHSFSAQNIFTTSNHWVGPLLDRGATCTIGYVDEPFLGCTLNVEAFADWLMRGASFGEAAYHALPSLSWQTTVIGDPLYRPFKLTFIDRYMETLSRNSDQSGWAEVVAANRALIKGEQPEIAVSAMEDEFKARAGDYAEGGWLLSCYEKEKKWEDALKVCQQMLKKLDPSSPVRRCSLLMKEAELCAQMKKYDLANSRFSILYEEYPALRMEKGFLERWKKIAKSAKARSDLRKIQKALRQIEDSE